MISRISYHHLYRISCSFNWSQDYWLDIVHSIDKRANTQKLKQYILTSVYHQSFIHSRWW